MLHKSKYMIIQSRKWLTPSITRFNYSSQTKQQESAITESVRTNDSGMLRTHKKNPKREPLVRNFFLGKVDKELLAYPEVVMDEDLVSLYKNTSSYGNFLDEQIFNSKSETSSKLESLKAGEAFGFNVSQKYGGKGFLKTETMFGSEIEAHNLSFCNLLNNHRLVTQIISEHGSDNQKLKYLPKLASGEMIGSIGFFESSPAVNNAFNVQAKFSDKNDNWSLKGEKSFLVNPSKSSLFLVYASTESKDRIGDLQNSITAFLVEGDSEGITFSDPDQTFSFEEVPQRNVQFDVIIPDSNVVGKIDDGLKIGMNTLKYSRIDTGLMALCLAKKMMNQMIEHNINGPARGNLK